MPAISVSTLPSLSGAEPLFWIVRYPAPIFAPFGVARLHGAVTTRSPALNCGPLAAAAGRIAINGFLIIDGLIVIAGWPEWSCAQPAEDVASTPSVAAPALLVRNTEKQRVIGLS